MIQHSTECGGETVQDTWDNGELLENFNVVGKCVEVCTAHDECVGFEVQENGICAWKSGTLTPVFALDRKCYRKLSSVPRNIHTSAPIKGYSV